MLQGCWQARQSSHHCGKSIVVTLRPPIFNRDVSALDVTAFTQALVKGGQSKGISLSRPGAHVSDHRHCRLLRARRERPRDRRAAERGYEFSPSDVACHVTLAWGSCPRNGRTVSHEGIFAGSSFLGKITTVSTRRHLLHHNPTAPAPPTAAARRGRRAARIV